MTHPDEALHVLVLRLVCGPTTALGESDPVMRELATRLATHSGIATT